MFFLEIWPSAALAEARIRKAVDRYALRYVELVRRAIEARAYRKDLDPYLAMSLLMGGLCHLTAVWLLYRRPYDLVERGTELFDLVEKSFLRPTRRVSAGTAPLRGAHDHDYERHGVARSQQRTRYRVSGSYDATVAGSCFQTSDWST